MNKPYSIRIYLPGGDPDGLRTVEKSNWNGAGIMIPRSLFSEAKQRRELQRAGVYVLIGPPEESGLPRIYIGEGDPIRSRLERHAAEKDFWTSCIGFTSKDENLNKAHVQFLESKLVSLAAKNKRCNLDNGTAPTLPSMSEPDVADAEGFLAEMLLCFPVLGVNVFSTIETAAVGSRSFYLAGKGVKATGSETADGFVVRSGSQAFKGNTPSIAPFLIQLRLALLNNGVLVDGGDHYRFTQDYVFSSPSTAASIVRGANTNGRAEWKTSDGRQLKEVQEADLSHTERDQ